MIATRRRARRSEAGFTLVELLLSIAIFSVLVVPLTAWAILVVGQQDDSQNALGRVNAIGLVNTYMPRDVASAARIKAGGSDCTGGGDGAGGAVKLQVTPAGGDGRILYVEAIPTDTDPATTRSLWRRQCDTNGVLLDEVEIIPGISPGSTVVTCPAATPAPDACERDVNRQVQFQVTPLRADGTPAQVIQLRLTRRTSSTSTGSPSFSNRNPQAQIEASPDAGYQPTVFRFSGTESWDSDGTIASYVWTFPAGASCTPSQGGAVQECTFGSGSDQLVQLRVNDDDGGYGTASTTVRIVNRFPVAQAAVSPASGELGTTSFTFDAAGSSDPDGAPLSYRWDLGPDLGAGRFVDGPTPAVTFPASATPGLRQVTLVVTDANQDTDTSVVLVRVDAPGGTGSTVLGGIAISPTLVNTAGLPRLPDPVGPDQPARVVTFADAEPLPPGSTGTWRLARAGGGAVVATSTDAVFSHQFGAGDGGSYDIIRVVQPPSGAPVEKAPVSFRVNTAPVASFTATGDGPAPRTVSFNSAGSNDDGRIVSFRWNLGFFDRWASTNPDPQQVLTDPGTYTVVLEVVDDDGAKSIATRQITVPGTPATPPAPTWDGWTLRWDPIPGVSEYRVFFQYDCGTVTALVAPSPTPAAVAVPPSQQCGVPGTVNASIEVDANRVLGGTSAPSPRTG